MLTVDSSNFDVLQTLEVAPGVSVEVEASGTGMALAVAELRYNVPNRPSEPCYDLDVQWFATDNGGEDHGSVRACGMPKPACERADGSGMAIISVGLFTGYRATHESLRARRTEGKVKRFETSDGRVDLYLNEIAPAPASTCVEFNVTRDFKVGGLRASASEVYEYYEPERRGTKVSDFAMTAYEPEPKPESEEEFQRVSDAPRVVTCTWTVVALSMSLSCIL
eukprot:gnl/TRDRNA2_/TRDRNA2_131958_c1_seq1.p1 gnl/TRDRNA2_/TRDRNA2_131958_c1~~gnl/TRDRNA2_/TRDRNA2_131958_c1_seq1.p1  ORF type:complete len:234 (-),score=52.09 gnl/TRDRNA2_/TRDRNA2_131958_c1_seq1:512-1180(-)